MIHDQLQTSGKSSSKKRRKNHNDDFMIPNMNSNNKKIYNKQIIKKLKPKAFERKKKKLDNINELDTKELMWINPAKVIIPKFSEVSQIFYTDENCFSSSEDSSTEKFEKIHVRFEKEESNYWKEVEKIVSANTHHKVN